MPGSNWMVVSTPENYVITRDRGFSMLGLKARHRKKAERMAAVHHKCLIISHLGEVAHGQKVLRPVLKNRAVAAIGDEFVGVFGNFWVEVILNHQLDGRRLPRPMRVFKNGHGDPILAAFFASKAA